jgi:hypothetical protein
MQNVSRGPALLFAFCILHFALAPGTAHAFKILEPKAGAALAPGAKVPTKVDLGKDTGVIEVRYFWYGEHDDVLVDKPDATSAGAIVAKPALVANAGGDPPFGGGLPVPEDAIGTLRLLAVGEISRGRLGVSSVFDEIFVKVEPTSELQTVEFETDKPLRLGRGESDPSIRPIAPAAGLENYGYVDSLGKIFQLPVVGVFADGVVRTITQPTTGTTYTSSNEQVIKVLAGGLLQIVGNGRTTLTVKNRGQEGDLDVIVALGDAMNEPPIADAGAPRQVKAGSRVELNGLRSRDPEGEALFYAWSQVRGAKLPLLDVNMPKASFVAPNVSEPRLFRFKLRVSDKQGADSLPVFVDVTVEP